MGSRRFAARPGRAAWRRNAVLPILAMLHCAPAPEPPNLVLVVIDTLRADRLGAYGGPRGASPALDRLARTGLTFDRAYATSTWTLGSIGSMFTGLYPSELGLRRMSSVLPADVPTLPEILRDRGYASAAVVSHTLAGSQHGFARGFEVFEEEEAQGYGHVCTPGVAASAERHLEELAARGARPFFLFVHLFDPHFDYLDHAEYPWAGPAPERLARGFTFWSLRSPELQHLSATEVSYLVDCYDEEIRLTDAGVGRILRALERTGAGARTIVAVVADHGEQFQEHGRIGHGANALVHEEVTRVPLILAGPGIGAGRVGTPASLIRLRATLLALLGIPDPAREPLPAAGSDAPSADALTEFVYSADRMPDQTKYALAGPVWKVSWCPPRHAPEVFDLLEDPGERTNLAATHPALRDSLVAALETAVDGLGERNPEDSPRTTLSAYQRERLEALGYTGD